MIPIQPGMAIQGIGSSDPTSALDPILIRGLVEIPTRLAQDGMSLTVVTNEPYLARNVADRFILMDEGGWFETAAPDEFFSNPKEARTCQFLEQISLKYSGGEL
jgi:general L-amino acid transport system ATP-binding protein